jgi:hypothetical protein
MRRLLTRNATPGGDPPRRRRYLPTSSAGLIVAIIALVVAISGSAYAASTLGKNSVGTKQLQKGAVTSKKIAANAVTSGKIKPGSIGSKKLKSTLVVPNANHANLADNATSATNATNATNATSATTAAGLANITYVQSPNITSPAGGGTVNNPSDTSGAVKCPTGLSAIAGGFTTSALGLEVNESQPTFGNGTTKPATGWNGFIDNFTATARTFSVWAICVPASAGGTAPPGAIANAKASTR